MSRRLSGGGNYIAGDEGQRYGPEVLFNRGGVSPPRLEHEETLTAALVATFWSAAPGCDDVQEIEWRRKLYCRG